MWMCPLVARMPCLGGMPDRTVLERGTVAISLAAAVRSARSCGSIGSHQLLGGHDQDAEHAVAGPRTLSVRQLPVDTLDCRVDLVTLRARDGMAAPAKGKGRIPALRQHLDGAWIDSKDDARLCWAMALKKQSRQASTAVRKTPVSPLAGSHVAGQSLVQDRLYAGERGAIVGYLRPDSTDLIVEDGGRGDPQRGQPSLILDT